MGFVAILALNMAILRRPECPQSAIGRDNGLRSEIKSFHWNYIFVESGPVGLPAVAVAASPGQI